MKRSIIFQLLLLPFLTFAQPELVDDFSPGADSSFPTWLQDDFGYLDGKIVLGMIHPDMGNEVAVIENGNVTILKDIVLGPESSEPSNFTSFKNEIYFTIENDVDDIDQLWKTDGTSEGTVLVNSFKDGYGISNVIVSDIEVMFFEFNSDYYAYDGSTFTMIGEGVSPGDDWLNASPVICKYGDGIAFVNSDNNDIYLYYSEGETLEVLATMEGNPSSNVTYQASGISPSKGGLTFGRGTTDWGISGQFFYDANTGTVEEIPFEGFISRYLDLDDEKEIFHALNDGFYVLAGNSYEKIYTSDISISQGAKINFAAHNGKMIFEGTDGFFGDAEFIFTDGTEAGTFPLMTAEQGTVTNIYSSEEFAYISVGISSPEIWKVNLETQAYELLYAYPDGNGQAELVGVMGDYLYFIGHQDNNVGSELYRLEINLETSTKDVNPNFTGLVKFYSNGFEVNTENQKPLQVNIVDASGRILSSITTETNTIHKNKLGSGQYFLQFILDGEQISSSHYFFE